MDIFDKVAKSRIFSYVLMFFAIMWLSELLQWTYSQDINNLTVQAVGLITAMLTALIALIKVIFTFAAYKPQQDKVK